MGDVKRYNPVCVYGDDGAPEAQMFAAATNGKYVEFSEFEAIQAQLAQAREQADEFREKADTWKLKHDDVYENYEAIGDSNKEYREEIEQLRDRLACGVDWVPIDIAGELKDGEQLLVRFQNSYGLGYYDADQHCLYDGHNYRDMRRAASVCRLIVITPSKPSGA